MKPFSIPPAQTLAAALRDAAAELQAQQPPPDLLARMKAGVQARADGSAPARAALADVERPAVAAGRPGPQIGASGAGSSRPGSTRPGSSRPGWAGWLGTGRAPVLALATVLGGTALLLVLRPPAPLVLPDDGLRYGGGAAAGFVAVAPAERWPRSDTPAWLVSTELQRERLAALGLPYDPGRAGDAVRADLLLHPSGEVLAVRLLN